MGVVGLHMDSSDYCEIVRQSHQLVSPAIVNPESLQYCAVTRVLLDLPQEGLGHDLADVRAKDGWVCSPTHVLGSRPLTDLKPGNIILTAEGTTRGDIEPLWPPYFGSSYSWRCARPDDTCGLNLPLGRSLRHCKHTR